MAAPWLRVLADAVEVQVRVVPRASRSRIAGVLGDRLKIQVAAPPIEGAANREVADVVARSAGLHARDASIVAGMTSRSKSVRLACDNPAEVAATLDELVARIR